jgi:hypothetical protein
MLVDTKPKKYRACELISRPAVIIERTESLKEHETRFLSGRVHSLEEMSNATPEVKEGSAPVFRYAHVGNAAFSTRECGFQYEPRINSSVQLRLISA